MIFSGILLFIILVGASEILFIAAERADKLEAEDKRKHEERMKSLVEYTDENDRTLEQIEKDAKSKAEQNLKKLKTLDTLDPELKKRLESTLKRFVS